jgi:hypothetical protein
MVHEDILITNCPVAGAPGHRSNPGSQSKRQPPQRFSTERFHVRILCCDMSGYCQEGERRKRMRHVRCRNHPRVRAINFFGSPAWSECRALPLGFAIEMLVPVVTVGVEKVEEYNPGHRFLWPGSSDSCKAQGTAGQSSAACSAEVTSHVDVALPMNGQTRLIHTAVQGGNQGRNPSCTSTKEILAIEA